MLLLHLEPIRIASANLDSNHYVQNTQTTQHAYTKNAQITPRLSALGQKKKILQYTKNKSKIEICLRLRK